MRKITSLIGLLCINMFAWGQTGQVENSPIYYKDGKVGIGTSNPNSKLEVGVTHTYHQDEEMRIGSYYQSKFIGVGLNYRIDGVGACSKHLVEYHGDIRTTLMTFSHNSKIGIGVNNPMQKLDLDGFFQIRGNSGSNDGGLGAINFFNSYSNSNSVLAQIQARRGIASHQKGDLAFFVKNGSSLQEAFRISANSFIGIGINKPVEKLHIQDGNILIKDASNNEVRNIYFVPSDNSKRNYIQGYQTAKPTDDYLQIGSHYGSIRFATESSNSPDEKMRITRSGRVGIGTTEPNAKLDVAGNIKAHEIAVTLAAMQDLQLKGTLAANNITYTANGNTADFVFEDNYDLKDLSEVEDFIKTNKHLPEIPSAVEMEEAGVNLAEMNKLLLMKVEELTLYSIQLEKEVKKEREERRAMRSEMEVRFAKLESLLSK